MDDIFRDIVESIFPDIKRRRDHAEYHETKESLMVEEPGEPYEPHPDEHLRWCKL